MQADRLQLAADTQEKLIQLAANDKLTDQERAAESTKIYADAAAAKVRLEADSSAQIYQIQKQRDDQQIQDTLRVTEAERAAAVAAAHCKAS